MVKHRTGHPTGGRPALSIVLPAHNEEHRIGPTLRDYLAYFDSDTTECIVVLNGCTDQTAAVVASVEEKLGWPMNVIDVAEAIGKGGAVQRGFLAARGEVVGFVDADGATTAEEFDRLFHQLDGFDGVIASRWIPGARVYNRTSPLRKLTSIGFVAIAKTLFGLPYRDTQCGAKIFRRPVIDAVAKQLQTRDMAFDVELLVRCQRAGFRIREVPSIWTDQTSSTVPTSPVKLAATSFKIFSSLLRLRATLRREETDV